MHERPIIDEILGRLPIGACGAAVRTVSLVAEADELCRRIEGDVRSGLRDEGTAARSLFYLPRYQGLGTELVDTTGLTPREAAGRIAR